MSNDKRNAGYQQQQPQSGRTQPGPGRSLEWIVGLKVRVVTALDDTIVGSVYSYCLNTNTLALIEEGEPVAGKADLKNVRILKASFIKSLNVLKKSEDSTGTGTGFGKISPAIGPVNLTSVNQKMNRAMRNASQNAIAVGVGISKDGQNLYDALARTLPVRWLNKAIYVLEEVKIEPPYTADSCLASDPESIALARVKKVVDGERRRLETIKQARSGSEDQKGG
ncbi:anticodon-binding domain-containing protein [Lipomyces arxii]|uniref:anticodon-binding domain-containing protein n=1 Tax=Lipomyces arxii TaxID=56418 RepID=UPI0034CE3F94